MKETLADIAWAINEHIYTKGTCPFCVLNNIF